MCYTDNDLSDVNIFVWHAGWLIDWLDIGLVELLGHFESFESYPHLSGQVKWTVQKPAALSQSNNLFNSVKHLVEEKSGIPTLLEVW